MAIPFKSPVPKHTFNSTKEKAAITRHFTKRNVPKSTNGRLLLASWNIANIGAQDRTLNAKRLIAHILKRFDLIAVQEVNDRFRTFASIVEMMGSKYVPFDRNPFIGSFSSGNFDFDKAAFKPLWEKLLKKIPKSKAIGLFNRHMKHHISDHRQLWVELDMT